MERDVDISSVAQRYREMIELNPYTKVVENRQFVPDPILSSVSLHLFHANHSHLDSTWKDAFRADTRARLYYVVDGTAEMTHHGKRYRMKPQHLYLIPTDTFLEFSCQKHIELKWVHFMACLKNGPDLFNHLDCSHEIKLDEPSVVEGHFDRLIDAFHASVATTTYAPQLEAIGYLTLLLVPFVEQIDIKAWEQKAELHSRLKPAIDFIEDNIARKSTVADLAKKVAMEASHFSKRFNQYFGVPPGKYIQNRRIQIAKSLLVETDETMESIGLSLGFFDGFHFSKCFKQSTHMSPKQFREKVKNCDLD